MIFETMGTLDEMNSVISVTHCLSQERIPDEEELLLSQQFPELTNIILPTNNITSSQYHVTQTVRGRKQKICERVGKHGDQMSVR